MSLTEPIETTVYCTGCEHLKRELAAAREEVAHHMALDSVDVDTINELKAELAALRKLCGEAAEQFNRCYDPGMVSRLAAAGRGEGK